jgi:AcrR family transcriptional regulator
MALYWHFRNKDELLEGMAASLLEAIDLTVDPAAPWHDQLRVALGSLIAVLQAHPATARLLSSRTVTSEGSLRATEALLEILRQGGFSPALATQVARHALRTVADLAAAQPGWVSANETAEAAEARRDARARLQALPRDRYPRLVEAAAPLSAQVSPDAYAAFGLDLLLAGIEALAARTD